MHHKQINILDLIYIIRGVPVMIASDLAFNRAHDRFLLIYEEVYHIGASIKDIGKKWFAFSLMRDIKASELMRMIR